ncbi:MAG: hypothetical protein B6U72_04250 [Candidatus Altiarchaeales archaeon ex4484_2]|nr:MAG: hypothetical protein B6U72_04250 [Candidatus Altiarchaeales archaeon ex4484_2]
MNLDEVIQEMDDTVDDSSIPRRIRRALEKISTDLRGDNPDTAVKVTTAIYELEAVVDDVNIPMHAKTMLWDLISNLESIREE